MPGATAAWHHGALCIGRTAIDRQHPAAAAQLCVLPIGHLGIPAATLARDLMAHVEPARWRRPGWGMVTPPGGRTLIVSADADTIHAVVAALARRERRSDSQPWTWVGGSASAAAAP